MDKFDYIRTAKGKVYQIIDIQEMDEGKLLICEDNEHKKQYTIGLEQVQYVNSKLYYLAQEGDLVRRNSYEPWILLENEWSILDFEESGIAEIITREDFAAFVNSCAFVAN